MLAIKLHSLIELKEIYTEDDAEDEKLKFLPIPKCSDNTCLHLFWNVLNLNSNYPFFSLLVRYRMRHDLRFFQNVHKYSKEKSSRRKKVKFKSLINNSISIKHKPKKTDRFNTSFTQYLTHQSSTNHHERCRAIDRHGISQR